jgi:hypothetical protein
MAEEAQPPLDAAWHRARRALLAVVALAAFAAHALNPAFAGGAKPDPHWGELSAAQRSILAPLAGEWDRLDSASRTRWLGVAQRYPKMTPIGQKRVQTRMKKWAALTPQQREEARAKYKRMKRKNDSTDLRREWQRYQALPPQEREALAAGQGKRKHQGAKSSKSGKNAKRKRPGAAPTTEDFSQ